MWGHSSGLQPRNVNTNQEGGLMLQRENERTLLDLKALKLRNKEPDCGVMQLNYLKG
jgi:hypothetical protein